MKTVSIYTLGCRLNQSESALLAERLAAAGYTLVPFGQPVDLGIIHTCTVTGEADAKCRKAIRAFIRDNPAAFVAVVGCYAQRDAETLARIPGVDLILGNQQKLRLAEYLSPGKNPTPRIICDNLTEDDFTIDLCGGSHLTRRANLKIQDGCNCRCTYCIVPLVRGRARSRDIDNAESEARALVRRGVKEIILTGVNLGVYAHGPHTLVDVVDRLNAINGLRRIRVSSIEVTAVPESLLDRMNDPGHALTPFLHIPLQSGSDRTLAAMGRPYSASDYLSFVRRAVSCVADLCIGADVLVGFPGETDEDFETTRRFLEEAPLAYAHVFVFSPRPGTPAATYPGQVDPRTAQRRSETIRQLADAKQRAYHARYLGKTLDVLFEDARDGVWQGYTGNYIRVAACSNEDLENEIRPVLLEKDQGEVVAGQLQV